ncbi:L,D-transpeptidase [Kitasatospora mediocidica]|uniref:L,D-transpeptidase n=1 Tax=Kitasatospora mediocidica TaxID=58352 RepID=UPI000A81B724|nr:Ig-like domain-containing protein [Kitasatospora mediocidica]
MAGTRAAGRENGTGRHRTLPAWLALAPLVLSPLAGCSDGGGQDGSGKPPRAVNAATLVNTSDVANADPAKPFTVTAKPGDKITDVTLKGPSGTVVAGALDSDGHGWHSTAPLAPATHYTARIAAADDKGARGETTADVSTKPADRLLTAALGPDLGRDVYGVGEPLTVQLSQPVTDPAARRQVEQGLTVFSQPAVTGAWHWVDDKNLHFRPQQYWPANASVRLTFDTQGRQIGTDGTYGGAPSRVAFHTGDRVEALVDASTDELTFKRNGEVVNTIPVTTGKPGFDTRNGIKVVLGQEREVQMSSETIGIAKGSSEAYDLKVEWATRVTWSGEYVHAAPWSVNSQGVENVSHGCTGMSTDNAEWFFQQTRVGDIVQVVNSKGHTMEPFGNGFGDWNLDWADWVKGSALGKEISTTSPTPVAAATATLRPQV